MLDQITGRPSTTWRRAQVVLVLTFWITRLGFGNRDGPRLAFLRRLNERLKRFTPWQIIVTTLLAVYTIRRGDKILGLGAPEPLARLYSADFYRATWLATALDAGFATGMHIRTKWLRDILSVAFSVYYVFAANEADEKLRKYRAFSSVEMMRATWEKATNPILSAVTNLRLPKIAVLTRVLIPRPSRSPYKKPLVIWIFFNGVEKELAKQTDVIFDIPGGGFVTMTPEHHKERLVLWAVRTNKVIISIDYGKAPEYPYPFAIDEVYDMYHLLHQTRGKVIGLNTGDPINVILTGDSAGANLATAAMIKILETPENPFPHPVALVFAYPALSFHLTSWMPPEDLKVLQQETESQTIASYSSSSIQNMMRRESKINLKQLLKTKDPLSHVSPLTVIAEDDDDVRLPRRKSSWRALNSPSLRRSATFVGSLFGMSDLEKLNADEDTASDVTDTDYQYNVSRGGSRSRQSSGNEMKLENRILWYDPEFKTVQKELETQNMKASESVLEKIRQAPLQTRLAMTSRSAFFNDRIISPAMCRAMAILYIGPHNAPDLHEDYHISPVFTPPHLLAQFPPVYLSCGERDPFVDDTVLFAGRIREAKEGRKADILARNKTLNVTDTIKSKDPLVTEEEEDWIQMRIISGWSHGYMQMKSLLPGATKAINLMADWITEAFEKHRDKNIPKAPKRPTLEGSGIFDNNNDKAMSSIAINGVPLKDEALNEMLSFRFTSRSKSPSVKNSPTVIADVEASSPPALDLEEESDDEDVHSSKNVLDSEQVESIRSASKAMQSCFNGHAAPETFKSKSSSLFVDPKDLLSRRKKEAAFGLSGGASGVETDEENDSHKRKAS